MSVAAAIRITSPGQEHVIQAACAFAANEGAQCYVIAVVDELPYGREAEEAREIVRENLAAIDGAGACPVMQEGTSVAETLVTVSAAFGVGTLFVLGGTSSVLRHSVAERLLHLDPPFDVVVVSARVGSEEAGGSTTARQFSDSSRKTSIA